MSYQHVGNYEEGDRVWFQQGDGNVWFGPELVLCQRGQRMCFHSMGDAKIVAACKVKPYELVERNILDSDKNQGNHIMLEDGLRVTKSIGLVKKDLKDDVGDRYLRMTS